MTSYRYPNEQFILGASLLLVVLVIAISATVTLFSSVVFIGIVFALAAFSNRSRHQALMRLAHPVNPQNEPHISDLVQLCVNCLRPGPVQAYIVPQQVMNAYTFGLESPKVVVLYSALFGVMDADELSFIIGHELGHVALGHTWLNSIVGGMAGIPGSSFFSAILTLAFLSWNRACELSADRAGLLACGKPEKAVSALIKLAAGPDGATARGLDLAYRRLEAEDDHLLAEFNEAFGTHPMLIHRIQELRRYAASPQFPRDLARTRASR